MALLRWLLVLCLCAASAGLQQINVESAKKVRLQCQGPKNGSITLLEWKRHDLQSEEYVFFYRDGRPHESFQHPGFKDRVELSDPQMKDGDMSIILYNTTIKDTGTYECCIIMGKARPRNRAASEIKHQINLRVDAPPGPTGGATEDEEEEDGGKEDELILGLLVAALLLAAAICFFLIYRKHINNEIQMRGPANSCTEPLNTDCYTSV